MSLAGRVAGVVLATISLDTAVSARHAAAEVSTLGAGQLESPALPGRAAGPGSPPGTTGGPPSTGAPSDATLRPPVVQPRVTGAATAPAGDRAAAGSPVLYAGSGRASRRGLWLVLAGGAFIAAGLVLHAWRRAKVSSNKEHPDA